TGSHVEASFSVPPGEYLFTAAFGPIEGTASRDAIRTLVAQADRAGPGVTRTPITVPDFWNGEFNTSSIMLATAIDPVPKPLTAQTLPTTFDLAAGHQLQSGQAVPLRAFAAGEYRLEITVKDRIAGAQIIRSVTFTVH